jgi:hypothetical protein
MIPHDRTIYGLMNKYIRTYTNYTYLHCQTLPLSPSLPTLIKLAVHLTPLKKLRSTLKPDMSMCTRTHNGFEAPRTASTSQFECCACATYDPSLVNDCTLSQFPQQFTVTPMMGDMSGRSLLFTLPRPFPSTDEVTEKDSRRTTCDARAPQAIPNLPFFENLRGESRTHDQTAGESMNGDCE